MEPWATNPLIKANQMLYMALFERAGYNAPSFAMTGQDIRIKN